jgi:NADH:quinone reductase (non-electrogenic)
VGRALAGPGRAQIVIVGGGFGGLFPAKALRCMPAHVRLIERNNYPRFQALRHRVASAALAPADVAQPSRSCVFLRRGSRLLTRTAPPEAAGAR